ncbi:DEAD/DEAH box helicase family protein [Thermithiobacillus plumbiphilus]|uniref:DEAD/DEAH box helicase family protein n=1 Tax=Thermithiobacillus plumbiphilus TaxID=1729899 RepID=A0ABU9D9F8_9PROT
MKRSVEHQQTIGTTDKAMLSCAGLCGINLATGYRTGEADPVAEFYRPCLEQATDYRRAVGYFRSSIFLIIGEEVIEFAKRGGRIRLICSPSITDEDLCSIEEGYSLREDKTDEALCTEIDCLLADETTHYRTRVLATLIAVGALDIRIAIRPNDQGIYHEKIGIFTDAFRNKVSFLGSANETWKGWHARGNLEAIEVFCNWAGPSDAERCQKHEAYFERLWSGQTKGVEVIAFPEAARKRISAVAMGDLGEVDMEEIRAIEKPGAKGRVPLGHQSRAIADWKAAGCRGVLEHATGSGKTFTALMAVREHVEKGMPALIVVPSRLLLEQWGVETRDEIPGATILLVGAGHDRWRQARRLYGMTDPSPDLGKRIVIATMQTVSSDEFLSTIQSGSHLLVVADEVHQTGSQQNSKLYLLKAGCRLGLSATPIRYGDPEGTQKMFDYFGPVIPPPVTLQDAIKAGRLVEYEYKPHTVRLTTEESEEWKALTLKIRWEMARQNEGADGKNPLSEAAKMLLIRRSRIAKKAANKVPLASKILKSSFSVGQRWLVYCEDKAQLSDVIEALKAKGLEPLRYHTDMEGDKDATLAHFKTFGGIMVSIKCLDEGVDIPAVDHALILASSQNPRQFIQRRGRVLRKAKWKNLAVIHDAVVVPVSLGDEPEQASLLKSEFIRAIEFAQSAINADAAVELRHIAATLGFDPDAPDDTGIEEDE